MYAAFCVLDPAFYELKYTYVLFRFRCVLYNNSGIFKQEQSNPMIPIVSELCNKDLIPELVRLPVDSSSSGCYAYFEIESSHSLDPES